MEKHQGVRTFDTNSKTSPKYILNIVQMRSNTGDVKSNLQSILQHSILKTEKDLLNELDSMEKLKTGTKIIIYNLAR